MRFNSINMIYDEETGNLTQYIIGYTSRQEDFSMDGQLTILAEGVDLGNILDIARDELAKLIKG